MSEKKIAEIIINEIKKRALCINKIFPSYEQEKLEGTNLYRAIFYSKKVMHVLMNLKEFLDFNDISTEEYKIVTFATEIIRSLPNIIAKEVLITVWKRINSDTYLKEPTYLYCPKEFTYFWFQLNLNDIGKVFFKR